jgi:hypothetical protein
MTQLCESGADAEVVVDFSKVDCGPANIAV